MKWNLARRWGIMTYQSLHWLILSLLFQTYYWRLHFSCRLRFWWKNTGYLNFFRYTTHLTLLLLLFSEHVRHFVHVDKLTVMFSAFVFLLVSKLKTWSYHNSHAMMRCSLVIANIWSYRRNCVTKKRLVCSKHVLFGSLSKRSQVKTQIQTLPVVSSSDKALKRRRNLVPLFLLNSSSCRW